MCIGSHPERSTIPAVSGAERHFQRSLLRRLVTGGFDASADIAGNVSAEVGEGSPVVMLAVPVDEAGWHVRSVGPEGDAILAPVGPVERASEGRLLSRETGRIAEVTLFERDGTLVARCMPAETSRPRAGDTVAGGLADIKWALAGAEGLLRSWSALSFSGRLAVSFLVKRYWAPECASLACTRVRPDIVLCLEGRQGHREMVEIPSGPALFDRAQGLLQASATSEGIGFQRPFASPGRSRWVEAMQLAPPFGCQTGMVCFETTGEGRAAREAIRVIDCALEGILDMRRIVQSACCYP